MLNRRHFLQCIVAAATTAPLLSSRKGATAARRALADLRADPAGLLDLAEGLRYRIMSRAGDPMSDGLRAPGAHDGMAAFPGDGGRVILVCNHELEYGSSYPSTHGDDYDTLPEEKQSLFYDRGAGRTPGLGGTTTTIWNPQTGATERQHLSLAGTELNCAGGPTPWGSWLSCEECFVGPGMSLSSAGVVHRDRRHGYVFEVPAGASGLVEPRPIRDMGRFEHEACAVHEPTGIVYMTEDQHHSLFYRYIPRIPGRLHEGGRLQALAVRGQSALVTHNWMPGRTVDLNDPLETTWIDLDDIDPVEDDLRERGAQAGAAMFARGEGLCASGDRFAFTCTIGGPARRGQVFTYTPSPFEGTDREAERPGRLELIAEADGKSLLTNADNLVMAPWGDLIVCEDTIDNVSCALIGVRPDGRQYPIAHNPYSESELAGVCFSPDGQTLFVNIQYPGATVAITGDFGQFA